MIRHFAGWVLLALLVCGCTREHPFEPVFTDEDGWSAGIQVARNNYQRVGVALTSPPSMQLARNIKSYRIEYTSSFDSSYTLLVELPSYVNAPRGLNIGRLFSYQSGAQFQQDVRYRIRVITSYLNGTTWASKDTLFTSPVVRGKILRTIPATIPLLNTFTFSEGFLYYTELANVFRIDTLTAVAEKISSNLPYAWGIAVSGDTLYALSTFNGREIVRRFGLPQFVELSSLDVNGPPGTYISAIAAEPSALWGVWTPKPAEGSQVTSSIYLVRYDLQTGLVTHTSPLISLPYPATALSILDGQIWTANPGIYWQFDNRIWRVDPATGQILEEHCNPLFDTRGLASDGAYFWVFDTEQFGFCKVAVEGT